MFGRKQEKKSKEREQLFKKEAYIPKKKLEKKERTLVTQSGRKRGSQEEPQSRGFGRKILVYFLWLLFLGEVIYVVLFAHFFPVDTITLDREGSDASISDTQIEAFLREPLEGSWYSLIPKNNLILLRSEQLESALLKRYPKLASVTIKKHFPSTLQVSVTEKAFQLVWCSRESCFLVSPEGVAMDAGIFFQYPDEQGKTLWIQDPREENISPGYAVLESEDQHFIEDLMKDFELRTGLAIEGSVERPSVHAREVRVHTNKGFSLFFNTHLPLDEALNNLMLLLQKEIPEGEWNQVDYIDLRTENRIYYTRKDRAPEKTDEQKQREEEEEKKKEEEAKQAEQQNQ